MPMSATVGSVHELTVAVAFVVGLNTAEIFGSLAMF